MLEELKAAEPAERGADTLTLDGAEWLGWLSIPSLELELPVQAEWSYPALKTSPCRYAGTPEAGLVIAAHNYEQHFARLNLLTAGGHGGVHGRERHRTPVYRHAGGDAGPHRRGGNDRRRLGFDPVHLHIQRPGPRNGALCEDGGVKRQMRR